LRAGQSEAAEPAAEHYYEQNSIAATIGARGQRRLRDQPLRPGRASVRRAAQPAVSGTTARPQQLRRGRQPLARALGRKTALNGYNYYMRINTARADLGLSEFDLPPAVPTFGPNPVGELVITNTAGEVALKLHVPSPSAQYTLVQGSAPRSTGIRCVQRFPFLGFLPEPVDGWSDITELYVAWYGLPPVRSAIFIRTCQHIDGWTDVPKLTRAIVPAA
jgi:hypothetical protein